MAFFENTRIGTKLILGYVVMSAIIVMIALFGVVNMNILAGNGEMMYEQALVPIHTLDNIETEIMSIRINILRYVLYPEERQDLKEAINTGFSGVYTNLDIYLTKYADTKDIANIQKLITLIHELEHQYKPVLEAADGGRQKEAIDSLSQNDLRIKIRNDILAIIDAEILESEQHANKLRIASHESAFTSTIIFSIVTLFAIIASLIFGFLLSRSITTPLAEVVSVADQIGQGKSSARINFTRKDEIGILAVTLNKMGDHISSLVEDTKILISATEKGELSVRADPSVHEGDFRLIISGFNTTLDSVIGPLNVAAEYVDRIAKGEIPPEITDPYYGDFNEIKNNLNTCISAVNLLVEDANKLTDAAVRGELSTRADPARHSGDFRKIVEGVNNTLDAVIGPLNVAAEYVDKIAKGDIPEPITDPYYGDFNEIKNNLNICIKAVNLLVEDAKGLTDAAVKGELSTRADPTRHSGDFRRIVEGVNTTLDAVIGPLNVAAEYVDRISKGEIPAPITDPYYGDFNEIKNNLNTCISAVNLLIEDANRLTEAAVRGELSTRADPFRHQGDFRKIVQGVNNTLDAVIGPLNVAAEYVDRIAKGDIPEEISDNYYGDFNEIKNNLNTCIRAINLMIDDSKMLTQAAIKGALGTRADSARHTGDFRTIVQGVNATLDAVVEPVHEAMRVSKDFAEGNFTARVNEALHVQGDFIDFKNALNKIGIELSRMMTMINEELFESVNVLSAASSEILSVTAELSSGTAQTATSVNETSATIEEVRKTTEMTNEKAKNVAEKAMTVSEVALTGQHSVEEILSGMTHIQQQMESIAGSVVKLSEQSQAIGEIIATVTDIAEQSNLLAVNASIEAAKAGEYGRGFGVVAQEIKNLAEQSKLATTHIRTILTDIQRGISSTVISTEQGTKTVATGLRLSNEARDAIEILSQSIAEAAKSSVQITASSQEQVVGMDQISSAMESIRMAAQNNLEVTRQVEKTAKDLHNLGIALKQITERFNL